MIFIQKSKIIAEIWFRGMDIRTHVCLSEYTSEAIPRTESVRLDTSHSGDLLA